MLEEKWKNAPVHEFSVADEQVWPLIQSLALMKYNGKNAPNPLLKKILNA